MTRLRTAAGATLALAVTAPLSAQTTATLDAGASAVRYDGWLGSGAIFLAPAVRYDGPGVSLGARGTAVVFESGNSILQGTLAGGWITRADRGVRVELSGSAGAAAYVDAPRYGHALGRVRLHATRDRSGVWVGGTTGRTFFGSTAQTPLEVAAGAWTAHNGLGAGATLTRSLVGDSAYTDVIGTGRWARGPVTVEGVGGARLWSRGAGSGAYGEVTLRARLTPWVTLTASGGRYPADPIRGVIAARYVSAGLRLRLAPRRAAPRSLAETLAAGRGRREDGPARLAVTATDVGQWALSVRVPARAGSVEIAGDFTDWQPIRLTQTAAGTWEIVLAIPPGVHRVNIRWDGGPWQAPAGLRRGEDEFGGEVGLLVIG